MNGTVLSLALSLAERVSDPNHGDFNASAENALRNDADWTKLSYYSKMTSESGRENNWASLLLFCMINFTLRSICSVVLSCFLIQGLVTIVPVAVSDLRPENISK